MVEKIKPKIMVLAIGPQTTERPPIPIAVGNSPAMVVSEVRIIGLKRVADALRTASKVL
jgi:hypothetical protein